MKLSRSIDTIISFKDSLVKYITLILAVISILLFNGIDSLASSSVTDILELDGNQSVSKSTLTKQEQTVSLKNPLLTSAVGQQKNEKQSIITINEIDKLLTRKLEKEVKDFYLPKLVMLFNDMNSILGITPAVHGQKEKSEQVKKEIEKKKNLTAKKQALHLRQFLVREESENTKEYYVQVGTWKNLNYAQKMLAKVRKYYPEVYMVVHNNLNKIRIPSVMGKKHAYIISKDIEAKFNMKALLVQKMQKSLCNIKTLQSSINDLEY